MAVDKSYPYPVLGNEDDIEGRFSFSMDYSLEPQRVILDCVFSLENETIEHLMQTGETVFIAEAICPATFFREVYSSATPNMSKSIQADKLRGQVTVSSYISAVKPIPEYLPEGTHADLQGEPFSLEAGDIIAVGGTAAFIADKTFDPLRAPVSSFIKIQRGEDKTGPMTAEYTADSIIIRLAQDDYDAYLIVKPTTAANIHASIVLPILTDTIHLMYSNKSVYQDQQWFTRIEQICMERGLNTDEPLECAQKILHFPIARGLRNIKEEIAEVD